MESESILALSLIFGLLGLGLFKYGKKDASITRTLCGLALMVYPYFVSNLIVLIVIGVGLIAIPFFIRD